jgi:glucokinase
MKHGDRDVHVGIDFGGTKLFGAVVGPDGSTANESYVEHGLQTGIPRDFSPEEAALGTPYARLCDLAAALVAAAKAAGKNPVGIGIGAPGMIGPGGLVMVAGAIGWKNAPLGPLMERRLGLPVRIENDVNLAALGEHAVGAGRGKSSLFLLAIGTAIGGATIVDGKLWRGRHFAAGEVGALLPGAEFLSWSDRDWGAFEAHASGTGLANQARLAAEKSQATPGPDQLRGEGLFAAAAAGVPWARQVVDRAVDMWTIAIAAVQAVLDPDLVVLSGGVSPSAAQFLPQIRERLGRALPQAPDIVISSLGYRAAVLGAPTLFAS